VSRWSHRAGVAGTCAAILVSWVVTFDNRRVATDDVLAPETVWAWWFGVFRREARTCRVSLPRGEAA